MKDTTPIHSTTVMLDDVCMPCEYRLSGKGAEIFLLSLGDIERAETALGKKRHQDLTQAARDFFASIPDGRKIVTLVSRPDTKQDSWSCRQILKRDIVLAGAPR